MLADYFHTCKYKYDPTKYHSFLNIREKGKIVLVAKLIKKYQSFICNEIISKEMLKVMIYLRKNMVYVSFLLNWYFNTSPISSCMSSSTFNEIMDLLRAGSKNTGISSDGFAVSIDIILF